MIHPQKDVAARVIEHQHTPALRKLLENDRTKKITMEVLFRKSTPNWKGEAPDNLRDVLSEKVASNTLQDTDWVGEVMSGAHRRLICSQLKKKYPNDMRHQLFDCTAHYIDERASEIAGAHEHGGNLNYLEDMRITSSLFNVINTVKMQHHERKRKNDKMTDKKFIDECLQTFQKKTTAFKKPDGFGREHLAIAVKMCKWSEQNWETFRRWFHPSKCGNEGKLSHEPPKDLSLFTHCKNMKESSCAWVTTDYINGDKSNIKKRLHDHRCKCSFSHSRDKQLKCAHFG